MIKKHASAPSLVMTGKTHLSVHKRFSSNLSSEFSDGDSISSEVSESHLTEVVSLSCSEISPTPMRRSRSREKKKKRPAPQPPGRSISMRNPGADRPTFIVVNQTSTDSESQTEFGFSKPTSQTLDSPEKDVFSTSPHVSPRDRSRLRAFKDALKSPRNIRKNSKKYKPEKDEIIGANGFKVSKNFLVEPPEFSSETFAVVFCEFDVDSEFEIKRIPEYDKYLNDLLDETDANHPDFDDLKKVANKVNSMVREREDGLREADNDNKVEAVQDRFPHDDLNLRDKSQKLRGLSTRRKSAPSAVLFKSLGSGKSKSSSSLWSQNTMGKKDGDVSMRPGSDANRLYIMEGPVTLAAGMQTQDRYLFLFSDLLLVAKQKSSTTFKLKNRIQLCDIWLAPCIDEVTEMTLPQERSFVIGWPTTNTVATFKDAETKEKWLTKLTGQVQEEKSKEESRTTQLKVVGRDIDQQKGTRHCTVTVHNTCEARDVLRMCMEQLLVSESEQKDYQLWVLTGKDTIYPLIGHEYPYAIKLSHVRDQLKPKGDVDSEVLSSMDSIMEESASPKVEFILKHKKSPKKHSLEDTSHKSSKKSKKSPLLTLFKRNNKDDKSLYSVPNSNSKPGKLFERPLEEVCDENNDPPKPIMELLTILFRQGPFTSGILRKSANARQIRELRQKLDNDEEVNLDEYSRYLLGSLVKDYFRTLPSCLFGDALYDQWVKTADIEDEQDRHDRVSELYQQLPICNRRLLDLLMSVLYQIDRHQDINMMGANNISVCIAPSLLWQKPDETSNLNNNSVTAVVSVVEFMINNVCTVIGDNIPHLLGEVDHKMRQDSGTDSDSLNNGLRRDDSSIDSLVDRDLYTGEADSSPKLAKSHLSPSNLSHDSGLSHSDTQLNEEEDYDTTERKIYHNGTAYIDSEMYSRSIDGRYNLDGQNPVAPPRYRKNRKDYQQSSSFDSYTRPYIPYSSNRLTHSLEPEVLREMQLNKRISCDSLQSVEESTEGESEHDFPSQRKSSDIYLIKSASGAHLYLDNETLPRMSSTEGQMGRQGRDRLVRQSSVTDSTPPLSPHSKFSYGSSYDSVLSDSSYMQDYSRGNSVNSAPQTPDEFSDRVMLWGTEERERSNSNPTRLHSNVNLSTESTVPSNKLSANYGGYSLKSVQNMRYLVSPPASPGVERRTKTESVKDPSVRHSMPATTYTTTVKKEVTSPQISITYCSSGSDERLDDNITGENVRRASFESGSSSGVPVKQISLYSQGLSSQSRFGLQNQRTSPRKDTTPVKASHDSAILSQIRRNSLESASRSDDDCESRTSSLPEGSTKSMLLQRSMGRSFEPVSNIDSSDLDDRRPHPPSYQEAVFRTNLIRQGKIPLEISEQEIQKQKEASARAKQLHEESLRKYYGASSSPEKSSPVQMKQTSHLKQHIEQTSDPLSKTYRTKVEQSSSVVQVISPEQDRDVYVTLRQKQHKKDPREVYAKSCSMYEQANEANKTDSKSDLLSSWSSRKENSSAGSFSRTSDSSRSYTSTDSSRDHQKSEGVRTKQDSVGSFVNTESNKNLKTILNVPSSSISRSLSDSADRLTKFSRYSPRVTRRDIEVNKENQNQKGRSDSSPSPVRSVPRTTYFYQPREDKQGTASSTSSTSIRQYSSKVSSQNCSTSSNVSKNQQSNSSSHTSVTVTVSNPSDIGSSSGSKELPWSVSKLKHMFDADETSGVTTTSSHFYNPEQKVSSVTVTSTSSRPGPPPYKSPPPFRRLVDNTRVSTSSSSSNGSSTNRSTSPKTRSYVSTRKFGPQSLDYNSFSSSSEDLDMSCRYPFRRKDSSSGVSDQEMDSYTDISYV